MTREEFIEILEKRGYSYEIVGDKIVITEDGLVYLYSYSLKTLPPDVEFRNGGSVNLGSEKTLPPGMVFRNKGDVYLESLETLPPDVKFNNGGSVYLISLKNLPPGVEFNNRGDVILHSLETLPPGVEFNNRGDVQLTVVWFNDWYGNIEGISRNTLLNGMIKRGIFL